MKRATRHPRSNPAAAAPLDTARAPAIVAKAFERLSLRRRARVLGRLLATLGPLALTVVGGGAFAKHVVHARWRRIPVSIDDAARVTRDQVCDVVRYVQQSNPQLVRRLLELLARDAARLASAGAAVAGPAIGPLATRGA